MSRLWITISSLIFLVIFSTSASFASTLTVSTAQELRTAINNATAGQTIQLAPGVYRLDQNLNCTTAGTAAHPITVRAASRGQALIQFSGGSGAAVEGFKVSAPNWIFENLDIVGTCETHHQCEHAFHLFGNADSTIIRHSRMREFNAMIKSNGLGEPRVFPDDVLIEGSEFFNSTPRNTDRPVTPIDVVGGRRWTIRANYIADFAKQGGNNISYAAFLKGNSQDGLFERNLVVCERHHQGGVRLGLSFGGGGTGPDSLCEEGRCDPEHQFGIMRNNIIMNCPADVGIYLNKASNVAIYNNTLYNTTGIDVRFSSSKADIRNNLLSGRIRNRDGATHTGGSNLEEVSLLQFSDWFQDPEGGDFCLFQEISQLVNQGQELPGLSNDYCDNRRVDGRLDIGALEYNSPSPCDTTMPVTDIPVIEETQACDVFCNGFE